MTHKFFAYSNSSKSVKLLTEVLGWKLLRRINSRFRPRINDTIINWGNSNLHPNLPFNIHYINHPSKVGVISNKLRYARQIISAGDDLPFRSISFTQSKDTAQSWLDAGSTVVARTILNGSEGRGIVITKPNGVLPNAQLYSKYQPKEQEFRVHVINGEVVKVQKKLRRKEEGVVVPEDIFLIRNTANGFRFCTVTEYPQDVAHQAVEAVKFFNLDFGGVDVIYKQARYARDAKAYVVEINSAPGIEGDTVTKYAEKFRLHFGER